jgi:hypothetical protein
MVKSFRLRKIHMPAFNDPSVRAWAEAYFVSHPWITTIIVGKDHKGDVWVDVVDVSDSHYVVSYPDRVPTLPKRLADIIAQTTAWGSHDSIERNQTSAMVCVGFLGSFKANDPTLLKHIRPCDSAGTHTPDQGFRTFIPFRRERPTGSSP